MKTAGRIGLSLFLFLFVAERAASIRPHHKDDTIRTVRKRVTTMLRERLGRRGKEVCYDLLGCFPIDRPLKKGPQDPTALDTRFYLFTREKDSEGLSYTDRRESLSASNFDPGKPTKFLVHGFKGSSKDKSAQAIVSRLLAMEDCNVILLDWQKGAQGPSYRLSAANTQIVGKQLELILLDLMSLGSSSSSIHLIGFSLGAHIAGYAGRALGERGIKLARITGLDPASPLFREHFSVSTLPALSKEDAALVDVVHTDGAIILTEGFGLLKALGHVDFFPNGGQDQPGCDYVFASVLVSHFEGTVNSSTVCNHVRGIQFFLESISKDGCQFRGFPCISRDHFKSGGCFPSKCETNSTDGSCGVMGFNAEKSLARGPLYLITRDQPPFCGDQLQGVAVLSKSGQKPRGQILLVVTVNEEATTFNLHNEARESSIGYAYRGLAASKYDTFHSGIKNVSAALVFRPTGRKLEELFILDYIRVSTIDGDFWSYCGRQILLEEKYGYEVATLDLVFKAC